MICFTLILTHKFGLLWWVIISPVHLLLYKIWAQLDFWNKVVIPVMGELIFRAVISLEFGINFGDPPSLSLSSAAACRLVIVSMSGILHACSCMHAMCPWGFRYSAAEPTQGLENVSEHWTRLGQRNCINMVICSLTEALKCHAILSRWLVPFILPSPLNFHNMSTRKDFRLTKAIYELV